MYNPSLNKAPRISGVYGDATSTSHAVYAIPAEWKGKRVTFQAVAQNLVIAFGTSASIEVGYSEVSTVVATVMTVNAKSGARITAGQDREFVLDADLTHFAIEAAGVGGWRGWNSDK